MAQAALITGGARRIGRALALALAQCGYDIALHYYHSREEAEQTREELLDQGAECELFAADLAVAEDLPELVGRVATVFPHCSVLINNASIFERCSFLETELEDFERHFNLNFKAPFFLTQAFARTFPHGQIVNLVDTKAMRTLTEYFAYTLSKKALLEFTRMAARALGPMHRVNAVAPGLILPPPGEDEAYLKQQAQSLPLQRHGSPERVVAAVRYLLENDFVTGECLVVDGGEQLK